MTFSDTLVLPENNITLFGLTMNGNGYQQIICSDDPMLASLICLTK